MSFVPRSGSRKTKRPKLRSKPDWDCTVNDLTAHKATPEEIEQRREAHRSKNLEIVRQSALKNRIMQVKRQALSDSTNRSQSTNAFLREILYNESEASRLMDDAQKALQVAHDIFGDDAKKYKAVPAITTICSDDEENFNADLPVLPDGLIKRFNEQPTKLEKLSDSVVRKVALNETYSASESEEESGEDSCSQDSIDRTPPASNPPRPDLERFKKLLEQEEISTIASEPSQKPEVNVNKPGEQTKAVKPVIKLHTANTLNSTCSKRKSRGSKTLKHLIPSAEGTDLKKLLQDLEASVAAYEKNYEIEPTGDDLQTNTFTSYTTTLISVVQKMMCYFKQIQERLKEEQIARTQLTENLTNQKYLVDALTSDVIKTQEQFCFMLDEFGQMKLGYRIELDDLQTTVSRMAKGNAVHTIEIDKPINKTVQQAAGTLQRSSTSPVVRTHPAFESSPERQSVLERVQTTPETHSQITPTVQLSDVATDSSVSQKLHGTAASTHESVSIEKQIEQLREDHHEALERFRRLCETRAELQRGMKPADSHVEQDTL